jgi:hypothetical protein
MRFAITLSRLERQLIGELARGPLMAELSHSDGSKRRQGPLHAFKKKRPIDKNVFGFTVAVGAATLRAMPSMSGGSQFGLLKYAGHVRPD